MTTANMIDLLQFKVRVVPDLRENDALILEILNQSQDRAIHLLSNHLLSELQVVETNKSLTNDGYDITTLSSTVYGGVAGVQYVKINGGKFCRKVSFREYQDHADSKMTFDTSEPVWYSRGTIVYPIPATSGTTIDFYFMKVPDTLAADTNSSINAKYHDLIVEIAESELWAGVGEFNRREDAITRVTEKILMFNIESPVTDMISENVGYDSTVVRDYVLTT